jgi:hypothetical protein
MVHIQTVSFLTPKSSSTEAGLNGKYLVYQMDEYDDSLVADKGKVFVHEYIDRDHGVARSFTPQKYLEGELPAGTNYLGSEVDYIYSTNLNQAKFGLDYFEADPNAQANDLNGDGKADILWRNYANGMNSVWLMNGTQRASDVFLNTVNELDWQIEGTGDFNNDGKTDILWRNYANGMNSVWLMNGTQRVSDVFLTAEGDQNWRIEGTGDFNNDGKTDILWRNYANGMNSVWLMNGTQRVSDVFLTAEGDQNWQIEGTGDFNNDGKTDILWRNHASGMNSVWLMNGTEKITDVFLDAEGDQNWQIGDTATKVINPDEQLNLAPPGLLSNSTNLSKLQNGELDGMRIDVDGYPSNDKYQCVDLTKFATNAIDTLTRNWKMRENVMANGNVAVGSAIATFLGPNNSYDNPVVINGETRWIQHTGIFAGYGSDGFYIWDQNWGTPDYIKKHFISAGGSDTSDASNYHVIQV